MIRKSLLLLLLLPVCAWSASRYRLSRWNVSPGNYSGITYLGNGRYAVVSDKDTDIAFHLWGVDIDTITGRLLNVRAIDKIVSSSHSSLTSRDAEGIAFCAQRGTVFVSGEADQRIVEYRLDGEATGLELPVPEQCGIRYIQSNRGFEALGYDSQCRTFWTCIESPLADGTGEGQLPFLQFRPNETSSAASPVWSLDSVVSYPLSEAKLPKGGRDYYHGVAAITCMPDASLLVLEREARITRSGSGSRCIVRLCRFWPQTGQKVQMEEWRSRFTPFNTRFANYEGMCLGPKLADGRQTLLVISDSQGGYGRGPWHLRDYLKIFLLPAS